MANLVNVGERRGKAISFATNRTTAPILSVETFSGALRKGSIIAAPISGHGRSCYAVARVTESLNKPCAAGAQTAVCRANLLGYWYNEPNKLSPLGSFESYHPTNILKYVESGAPVYFVTGKAREDFKKVYESYTRSPL